MATTKQVIRGDSYGPLRPLFIMKFASPTGARYNLRGATIRTTYKQSPTDVNTDPTDEEAAIKHELVINDEGEVVSSFGLALIGDATDGVVHEYLSSQESKALPLNLLLYSDVQIEIGTDTITFMQDTPIIAVEGITNRGN